MQEEQKEQNQAPYGDQPIAQNMNVASPAGSTSEVGRTIFVVGGMILTVCLIGLITFFGVKKLMRPEGKIVFLSDPEGAYVMDAETQRILGKTPFGTDLSPGTYEFSLTLEKYAPQVLKVVVNDTEEELEFNTALAQKENLIVDTEPEGATIYLDYKEVGFAPASLYVSNGEHEVLIRKEGYVDIYSKISISDDMPQERIQLSLVNSADQALKDEQILADTKMKECKKDCTCQGGDCENGLGVFIFQDTPTKYTGVFKNGSFEGLGRMEWENGDSFVGQFENNERRKGVYTWASGDIYVGEFIGGEMDGPGTYYFSQGHVYKGNWEKGFQNGFGTFIFQDGGNLIGNWSQNQCIDCYCESRNDCTIDFLRTE